MELFGSLPEQRADDRHRLLVTDAERAPGVMRKSPLYETAYRALKTPDKQAVSDLLDLTNLSLREREVVKRSVIDGQRLETICNSFQHWGKKSVCSYSHMVRIKGSGMKKIGLYLTGKHSPCRCG